MASIARSTLLRQAAVIAAPSSRSIATSSRAGPSLIAALGRNALVRQSTHGGLFARGSMQVAAFHATSRRSLLPPGPQRIEGTVNDAAPVKEPSPSHGHYHWTFDRILAAGLIPITVAPFAAGSLNPALDAILAGGILIHAHTSFQQAIIDYVPKYRFPGWHRLVMWLLNGATVLAGVGLYEFETTDVGLVEAIKRIWKA